MKNLAKEMKQEKVFTMGMAVIAVLYGLATIPVLLMAGTKLFLIKVMQTLPDVLVMMALVTVASLVMVLIKEKATEPKQAVKITKPEVKTEAVAERTMLPTEFVLSCMTPIEREYLDDYEYYMQQYSKNVQMQEEKYLVMRSILLTTNPEPLTLKEMAELTVIRNIRQKKWEQ